MTLHLRWKRDVDVDADACKDNDTCLLQVDLEVESNYDLGSLRLVA